MQQGPEQKNRTVGWIILGALLLLIGQRFLLAALFPLLLGVLLLAGLLFWAARLGWLREPDPAAEEFVRRFREHQARLADLESRSEQMRVTLRDLRSLQVSPEDLTRARWAEVELEERLTQTQHRLVAERAALFQLEALQWLQQLEPLLRAPEPTTPAALRGMPVRVRILREQGAPILARLRSDAEVTALPVGASTQRLLEEALQELEALRAHLVTRRAALLSQDAAEPADRPESEALARLRELLHVTRARGEARPWFPEE